MNQFVQPHKSPAEAHASQIQVAFIQSCWHKDIVDRCRDAFLAAMKEGNVPSSAIDLYEVPGAFEIPLLAQRLAKGGRYSAIVASGLVVNGGIYRHEFVAEAVISGLMRVQLDTNVPVLSAVLTPHHFHEHETHRSFFASHFDTKGREAAVACLAVTRAFYEQPVNR
ncbi:6,7-dimethyl-8-ribityllumazine synthase [Microvirga aerilata]|uniref:6,7-dimethyl-8-ribityllumazine synthase n=1 Tax=Microvirga aerilata TaxID=670292 RepID=A0A936Z5L8_9HYPH|nr:6,7-dimethyl-8-ribityllumazine synthase [Microvirga aerilata]MBL0402726.1 6,7-dimethyl-8-ribityllumazine synthase [Microvirga aerilata]